MSDHNILEVNLYKQVRQNYHAKNEKHYQVNDFRKLNFFSENVDWNSLNDRFQQTDWNIMNNCESVEENLKFFIEICKEKSEKHIPQKKRIFKKERNTTGSKNTGAEKKENKEKNGSSQKHRKTERHREFKRNRRRPSKFV